MLLLGLAPDGGCLAAVLLPAPVGFYSTISPLPLTRRYISVARSGRLLHPGGYPASCSMECGLVVCKGFSPTSEWNFRARRTAGYAPGLGRAEPIVSRVTNVGRDDPAPSMVSNTPMKFLLPFFPALLKELPAYTICMVLIATINLYIY